MKKYLSLISNPIKLYLKHSTSYFPLKNGFFFSTNNIKSSETEMSKVFNILEILELDPTDSAEHIKVKICPLCPKPHNDDPTNFNTLNIHKEKKVFHCFRCGSKGHLKRFLKILSKMNESINEINSGSTSASASGTEVEFNYIPDNIIEYKENERDIIGDFEDRNDNINEKVKAKKKEKEGNIYKNKEKYNENKNEISNNSQLINEYNLSNLEFEKRIKIDNPLLLNNSNIMNEMFKRIKGFDNKNSLVITDYLINVRKIKLETLKLFKVGISFEKFSNSTNGSFNLPCISYPMFIPLSCFQVIKMDKQTVPDEIYNFFDCNRLYLSKIKIRAIGKELKKFQRIEPSGALFPGLFGLDLIDFSKKEICITEGEYDAMAVYQETNIQTVSLPNGCSSLPSELIPVLSHFEKIYLWMDSDQPGKVASENFAKKIGLSKTYIINSRKSNPNGPKDANDALKMGVDLNIFFKDAKLLAGENIIQFNEIRSDIIQFLSQYEHFSGYKSNTFQFFNEKLKGLRTGEFTILTGETGCGKTTFLTQLSLDFLEQRIPTLWGSFEIKNDKLASLFLMQLAHKDLRQKPINEIEYYSDQFEKLPLFLLKFHGAQTIDDIMNSINFAVLNNDIQIIVLDNLQFMTGHNPKQNKFDIQDEIIHKLRLFATDKNVHIFLVIHPKKTDEALRITSIFGTGKASQEADNIMIIQNFKGLRIIEIAKNRFNGNTGKAVLAFDKNICRFFEIQENDFISYSKGEISIEHLIQQNRNEYEIKKLAENKKIGETLKLAEERNLIIDNINDNNSISIDNDNNQNQKEEENTISKLDNNYVDLEINHKIDVINEKSDLIEQIQETNKTQKNDEKNETEIEVNKKKITKKKVQKKENAEDVLGSQIIKEEIEDKTKKKSNIKKEDAKKEIKNEIKIESIKENMVFNFNQLCLNNRNELNEEDFELVDLNKIGSFHNEILKNDKIINSFHTIETKKDTQSISKTKEKPNRESIKELMLRNDLF